jgi:hypothetical protein
VAIVIKFNCKYQFDWRPGEMAWQCAISKLVHFGSHLEIVIETYEPVTVIVGETSSGYFVFFKSNCTGVDLRSLFNIDMNFKTLSDVCWDEQKAATVAFAIKRVGHLISPSWRKRKPADTG